MHVPMNSMSIFFCALTWCSSVVGQGVPYSSSDLAQLDDGRDHLSGKSKPDPLLKKHVLWPRSLPRPDPVTYASWYKKSGLPDFPDLAWESDDELPHVSAEAKVDLFYLTKPVFGAFGLATRVWHGGIGFRVENGSSFLFEYSSMDFEAAIAFPNKNGSSMSWPCTAIVDYLSDPSGKTFPDAGAKWKETYAVGTTTGAGFNSFAAWAYQFGRDHARYLVWRALENGTERTLMESAQCFDFVFEGLRFLHDTGIAKINVTELPATVVNVYVSEIETVPLSTAVTNFFASKRKVLEEFLQLTGDFSILGHSKEWYWPAWFSPTKYGGGTGQLQQDSDTPETYHRYVLQWPKSSKSTATALGCGRTNRTIFEKSSVLVLI